MFIGRTCEIRILNKNDNQRNPRLWITGKYQVHADCFLYHDFCIMYIPEHCIVLIFDNFRIYFLIKQCLSVLPFFVLTLSNLGKSLTDVACVLYDISVGNNNSYLFILLQCWMKIKNIFSRIKLMTNTPVQSHPQPTQYRFSPLTKVIFVH